MSKRVYFDIPSDLAFLFDPGETPWAELPDIVARPDVPLTTETVGIDTDFTISAGEAYVGIDGPQSLIQFSGDSGTSLVNNGTVWLQSVANPVIALSVSRPGTVVNNGDIVSASRDDYVQGVATYRGVLQNNGSITALSIDRSATGFMARSHDANWGTGPHQNTGEIIAWSNYRAVGVWITAGSLDNSGTIQAKGRDRATGIYCDGGRSSDLISNSGLIEAVSGNWDSVGIHLSRSWIRVENSGTIRADTAILAEANRLDFTNHSNGIVEGDIHLSGGQQTIVNDGSITGDVTFGGGGDTFNQSSAGRLYGRLDMGGGSDVADMGDGDDIVYGGDGADQIFGRGGDDILGGGRGADTIDGGDGNDFADYSESSLGVHVDLGAGSAIGGHASGDVLSNIENLRGSIFADELLGDSGDNSFIGDGGDDIIRGGAGHDTAAYSGSESDYSVVHNADGSTTVTDLRADSPDGTDTLFDIETLQFGVSVTPSSVVAAPPPVPLEEFLFGTGGGPWAPLPDVMDRPEGALSRSISISESNYTIESGDAIIAIQTAARLFQDEHWGPSITNNGTLWMQANNWDLSIHDYGNWYDFFNNGYIVLISDSGNIEGFDLYTHHLLINHGSITLISGDGDVLGVDAGAGFGNESNIHINSGSFDIWAGGEAYGMRLEGAYVENSGVFKVSGREKSVVYYSTNSMFTSITNSGWIESISEDSDSIAIHLNWSGDAIINNSGMIIADIAINISFYYLENVEINNFESGVIDGDIVLERSVDSFTNSGVIVGDVYLGELNDHFIQAGVGRIDGILDLGEGDDRADMADAADIVFGGAGNDVINGNGGNDVLAGGRGADSINGGNGIDYADYSSSTLGVSVNLQSGAASGGDASGDTLSNIENLRGSIFDDELVGDAGDNTLIGDGGDDLIDGGAGEDVARYSGAESDYSVTHNADGSITVSDLRNESPDGTDTLRNIEHIEFGASVLPSPIVRIPALTDLESVLFTGGAAPWAPLPALPHRPESGFESLHTLYASDYEVLNGEAHVAVNSATSLFDAALISGWSTLSNSGLLWLQHQSENVALLHSGRWGEVVNQGYMIAASQSGNAFGFATSTNGYLLNYGALVAISAQNSAIAYQTDDWGARRGDFDHLNTGLLEAWGGHEAHAVILRSGGHFLNSGTVRATGQNKTIAVRTDSHFFTNAITNSGLIEARSASSDSAGIVFWRVENGLVDNSGTIRAKTAVQVDNDWIKGNFLLNNLSGGLIEGQIQLENTIDTIVNAGTIIGDIFLGDHDDSYTQTGAGRFDGMLDLGDGDDVADMGDSADTVIGGAGEDIIRGHGGDDRLAGGAGADALDGGAGIDFADYSASGQGVEVDLGAGTASGGDAGGDELTNIENLIGSGQDDILTGNNSNNVLAGGGGDDVLRGGAGDDTAVFSGERSDYDIVENADGSVTVTDLRAGSPDGTDTLYDIENLWFGVTATPGRVLGGSRGIEVLTGSDGNDLLLGREGLDLLAGGGGADTLDGGAGQDYADYRTSAAGVVVDLSTGTGSGGDAQGDTLIAIENVIGSGHDDHLIGDDGDNVFMGGGGNDTLRGRGGHDIAIFSGAEADYSVTYNTDGSITVTDLRVGSPDGTDRLFGIETLWFGAAGTPGKTNFGTDGNNRMRGSDLDDFLSGAGGIDFILGGGGSDTLSGGNDNDVIGGGDGDDTVNGDAGNDKLYGQDGDDLINGGSGNDVLVGGEGDDTLNAGDGVDKVRGGNGNDVIDGGAGNDTLHGQGGNDTIHGGLGDDFIAGGQGDDTLHGDAGADRISGGGGNDIVNGGGGNDILAGQSGDDTFTGGAGDDRIDGGGGQDDRAVFSGDHADYSLSYAAGTGWVYVTDLRDGSPDGADRLLRVEYLEFADGVVAVNAGAFDFTPASAVPPAASAEAQLPGPDIMDLLEDDLFVDLSRDAEFDGLTVLSAGSWHDGIARLIESDELPALNDQSEAAAWAVPSGQPPANDPDIPVIPDDMWA